MTPRASTVMAGRPPAPGRGIGFSVFAERHAEALRQKATRQAWRDGETVLACGAVVPVVMTIVRGRLRISVTATDGTEVFFRWYQAGEVVGLVSAVDRLPFPVNAVALDRCETLAVERETLLAMMVSDAQFAVTVSHVLARHAWDMCNLVAARTSQSLNGRVFGVVSHLARVNGTLQRDGSWKLAISQQALAEAVGASRQRVNAELCALESAGKLRLGYGHVILADGVHATALLPDQPELGPRFDY